MKKVFVLIVLFALPVTIYIIFGSAVHNFVHLPTLTEEIDNLDHFTPLEENQPLAFEDYVTVLCIYGSDINSKHGNAYNLFEKIYKKNYIYKDFQVIVLAEDGQQKEARELIDELHNFTGVNASKWRFAFGSAEDIQQLFNSMQTDLNLDQHAATPYAFVIDKHRSLRGRKKNAKDTDKTQYGYETGSIAALNNTMVDDVNVLLAEYRFKLKTNEKDNYLKHKEDKDE